MTARRNIGWCGPISGIIAWKIAIFRIWHTLAEVKLFVFLFLIKLFLNCCCSIDVSYCFAHLLCMYFFYCLLLLFFLRSALCVEIFMYCRVCRRDRYWDKGHSQEAIRRQCQEAMSRWSIRVTAFEVKVACMGVLISRELQRWIVKCELVKRVLRQCGSPAVLQSGTRWIDEYSWVKCKSVRRMLPQSPSRWIAKC